MENMEKTPGFPMISMHLRCVSGCPASHDLHQQGPIQALERRLVADGVEVGDDEVERHRAHRLGALHVHAAASFKELQHVVLPRPDTSAVIHHT